MTGLLASLGLTDHAVEPHRAYEGPRFGREAVKPSDDLTRISGLPRRAPPSLAEQSQMAAVMTSLLARPNPACKCKELRPYAAEPCLTRFFPVQGWYLWEAMTNVGAVGMLAAGAGKTALDVFLAMVVPGVKRACLMIPPALRAQFAANYVEWSQHFHVPNVVDSGLPFTAGAPKLDVLSYSELSNESCAQWLSLHKPDIVICDEAHALKDKNATRTSRFLRYFIEHDESRLFWHSGSPTTRSPDDCAHLAALALREASPYPLEPSTVGEWSEALGAKATIGEGALMRLAAPGETARQGFRRRLVETAGVITTEDAQLDVPLKIRVRPVAVPSILDEALVLVRGGERPDTMTGSHFGEELTEQVEVVACARQVALGFFYRWKYPRGEPVELIDAWFAKRKAFGQELRLKLERRTDLMDSPALLRDAAQRHHENYRGHLPTWAAASWPAWRDIQDSVWPEQETQWLDDSIVKDAVEWGREAPGIVWYSHVEFGRRVAAEGGFEIFEGGDEASIRIQTVSGEKTIVASVDAHGTGKNLQMFSRGLITAPFAGGGKWEQVLARLHRYGQKAPAVVFDVYLHTPELRAALDSGLEDARYVYETTGKAERLLFAEKDLG